MSFISNTVIPFVASNPWLTIIILVVIYWIIEEIGLYHADD
jgi:hypothetical protein